MDLTSLSEISATELSTVEYFEKVRWGGNTVCPYCGSMNIGTRNYDYRFHCKHCQKTFSVKTNTQLHDSRLPLEKWLQAFNLISNDKEGLSAMNLQRNLKLSYETAWTICHRIRDLMVLDNDLSELQNVTEIDTTFVGGKDRKCQVASKGTPASIPELDEAKEEYESLGFKFKEGKYKKPCKMEKSKRGKGADKEIVAGIVERDGDVVAKVIPFATYKELKVLVDKYVNVDESVMVMDSDTAQIKLGKIIDNIVIDHKKMYSYRGINTNSIESFWARIKRQLGNYHHVSPEYLHKYIAEGVFKHNHRHEDDMFEILVKLSMTEKSQ